MIDWSLAVSTAQHMLPNGPPIEADEAQALIQSLYAAAEEAESLGAERQGSGPTVGDRVAALNESSEQGSLIAIEESEAGNDSDSE